MDTKNRGEPSFSMVWLFQRAADSVSPQRHLFEGVPTFVWVASASCLCFDEVRGLGAKHLYMCSEENTTFRNRVSQGTSGEHTYTLHIMCTASCASVYILVSCSHATATFCRPSHTSTLYSRGNSSVAAARRTAADITDTNVYIAHVLRVPPPHRYL
jgi:hypothetical protein